MVGDRRRCHHTFSSLRCTSHHHVENPKGERGGEPDLAHPKGDDERERERMNHRPPSRREERMRAMWAMITVEASRIVGYLRLASSAL
jgi:hypothetical protein